MHKNIWLDLPIKFFVLNNQGYASIRTTQKNYFDGRFVASDPESGLTLPDIRKIAEAFSIPSIQIKNHKNREKTWQWNKVCASSKDENPEETGNKAAMWHGDRDTG